MGREKSGGNLLHTETSCAIGEGRVWLGVQVREGVEVVDVDGGHVDGCVFLFSKKHWEVKRGEDGVMKERRRMNEWMDGWMKKETRDNIQTLFLERAFFAWTLSGDSFA
jgi:hypothetical protein